VSTSRSHHRRRHGEDQGNQYRRQQGFQRVDPAQSVRPGHRRLAQLVHQVGPVFARQAQRRLEALALLLPHARLSGVSRRLHPGGDSPDKQEIDITINITEGERYVVSGSQARRQLPGQGRRIQEPGGDPARRALQRRRCGQTTKAFTDYFGNYGFAFARVEARPEVDRVNNRVAGAPGRTIASGLCPAHQRGGNNRTRDEVVRREFRQFEVGLVRRRQDPRRAIASTAWVTSREVSIETLEIAGAPDQVDLTITVARKADRQPVSWERVFSG
jgi:hypothetical protein